MAARLFSTGLPTASCLLTRRVPYLTLPHEFVAFGEGAPCARRSETDRLASRPHRTASSIETQRVFALLEQSPAGERARGFGQGEPAAMLHDGERRGMQRQQFQRGGVFPFQRIGRI